MSEAQHQGKLIYSSAPWKIYEQDAGMGERDYAVIINDIFYCRTDDSQTAMKIVESIRSRPAPSPENHDVDCAYMAGMHDGQIKLKAHDTAIRNATLDEVIAFCEFPHSAPLHEETAFRVVRYAKSLRTNQEPKP